MILKVLDAKPLAKRNLISKLANFSIRKPKLSLGCVDSKGESIEWSQKLTPKLAKTQEMAKISLFQKFWKGVISMFDWQFLAMSV